MPSSAEDSERGVLCLFLPFPILWSAERMFTGAPISDKRCAAVRNRRMIQLARWRTFVSVVEPDKPGKVFVDQILNTPPKQPARTGVLKDSPPSSVVCERMLAMLYRSVNVPSCWTARSCHRRQHSRSISSWHETLTEHCTCTECKSEHSPVVVTYRHWSSDPRSS